MGRLVKTPVEAVRRDLPEDGKAGGGLAGGFGDVSVAELVSLFSQERGISEHFYMRHNTLRDFMRHARVFAFRSFLPFRPFMALIEAFTGGTKEESIDEHDVIEHTSQKDTGTRKRRLTKFRGLPSWFKPMGETINPIDIDGPIGPIMGAATALVK